MIPENKPFIHFVCPACGGKLQNTSSPDRIVCDHCGNEYLVNTGGGINRVEPAQAEEPSFTAPREVDKERFEKGEETEAEKADQKRENSWMMGVAVILMGIMFLLDKSGVAHVNNWWAVFLISPAVGSFMRAIRRYKEEGMITRRVTAPIIGGVASLILALFFLLDLNIGQLWPIFVILAGISILISFFVKK